MNYKDINDYETIYMIRENNDEAINNMYEKYKPLIKRLSLSFFMKYKHIGIDYDDLYQEGMYGLSEAIANYNINESNLFYTFAVICIKREMQRLIIKSNRYKNNVLNYAMSLDTIISDEGLILEDVIYDEDQIVDKYVFDIYEKKNILDLKYLLKDVYSWVFELKINGFSNTDISVLLDITYKDVDNYLRSIKKNLKKYSNCCMNY